jgi:hypothetical protein
VISPDLTWGTNIHGERERSGLLSGDLTLPSPPATTITEHVCCTWLAPPLPFDGKPCSEDRTNEFLPVLDVDAVAVHGHNVLLRNGSSPLDLPALELLPAGSTTG